MSRRLAIVAAGLMLTFGLLRLAAATEINPAADRLRALPDQLGPWRATETFRLDRDTENILQADDYVLRTYSRGIAPVALFVAFYGSQRAGRTIHSPLNCLPGTGWEWIERQRATVRAQDGVDIAVNRNIARKDAQDLLVYYWYQSRGRVVASDYANKLFLVGDALARHRSDGALVRVTADAATGNGAAAREAAAFIQTIYPALTAHLPE
jgi:EpsI family protein